MASEQVNAELLRGFSPLDGLKQDNLAALARKVQVREISPGQVLFKEGDTEKRTLYIVSGTLELIDQKKVIGTVEGGSERARNPVAPVYPRRVTARAKNRVQFISPSPSASPAIAAKKRTAGRAIPSSSRVKVVVSRAAASCIAVETLNGAKPAAVRFEPETSRT